MTLAIANVSKTYANGIRALRDVTLTIPTGMFGLLGPNGSGKSTLMRSVATLQEVDGGTIHLGEIDVRREKQAVRRLLGYLPQDFGLYQNITAHALLSHLATLKGITRAAHREAAVEALLRQTNLWEVRDKRLGTFSGGMRQRFGVAQALLGEPQLIIVDEPTAGLDPEERRRFLNLLAEIGEQVVVILSTHIVDDVSQVCSRMAIIHLGQVLLTSEPQTAIAKLRGRTWRKTIRRADLEEYRRSMRVISSRLAAGQLIIHVLCDEQPDESFTAASPTLEDVYFTVLARSNGGGQDNVR